MERKDIRWEQRFSNYRKALEKLSQVVKMDYKKLSELELEGLIQRFEYTYELAWKTLQDLLRAKGYTDIAGPNPVIDQAFQDGYITDGEGWKRLKKSRELTAHTYDEATAKEIADNIVNEYYGLFKALEEKLVQEGSGKQPTTIK